MTGNSRKIYLDHAATTPVDPAVLRAMRPYFFERYGNPGSLHAFGQEAISAVDRARQAAAASLRADFREVVFTGSATEANNLALRGAVALWRSSRPETPRIIVSAAEHESVLLTARALAGNGGADLAVLPVGRNGRIRPRDLVAALTPSTAVVSVMYANNETGAVEDIPGIAKIILTARASAGSEWPLFHTDAVQAFQFLRTIPSELGADLLTLSAHKIYGPKGIGALFVSRSLPSILTGGGQEFGMRSGTENVPAIVGFAKALSLADGLREKESHRLRMLAARLISRLGREMKLNSVMDSRGGAGLPHIINIRTPVAAEILLLELDQAGLAVSTGSACASRSHESSHVLRAMGLSDRDARRSIRLSLGRKTRTEDIDAAARLVKKLVKKHSP